MTDAPLGDGTTQRGSDMILHDEIGEAAGTVAAGERNGHGRYRRGRDEKCPRRSEATLDIA